MLLEEFELEEKDFGFQEMIPVFHEYADLAKSIQTHID